MRNLFCVFLILMSFLCADAQTVFAQRRQKNRDSFLNTSSSKSIFLFLLEKLNAFFKVCAFTMFALCIHLPAEAQAPVITSFSPEPICQGETVTITGTDFTGATTVKIGNQDALSFKVNNATTITAVVPDNSSGGTIMVTTPNGTASSNTKLTVQTAPIPALGDESTLDIPFTNCDGNAVYQITVANQSTQVASQSDFDIDWGDGSAHFTQKDWTLNAQTSHTYNSQGYFNIKLTIKPPNGCTKSKIYRFYNGSNPLASLSTELPTTGLCADTIVTFLIGGKWFNNSTGTTYQLDFGDGSSPVVLQHPLNSNNTDEKVPHNYTTTSCPQVDFTATLKAINGCYTTTYTQDQIVVRIKPSADFTTNPITACVNTEVCFSNQTVNGFSGTSCNRNTNFTWSFGDGSATSTEVNPCHTYSNAGSYPVSLTASNTSCGGDNKFKPVVVYPISPTPVVSGSPVNYCQGQPATPLTATGSGLLWYTTSSGGTGSPTAPTPSTANTGTHLYYVSQTLTNNCESPRVVITVVVNAAPKPPGVITPVLLCQGGSASQLSATGTDLLWYTTSNGGTGSPTAPIPSTANIGSSNYYVSQTAGGCEGERSQITVVVNAIPTFTATSLSPTNCGTSNGSIQLTKLSPNTSYTITYTQDGATKSAKQTSDAGGVINLINLAAGLYDQLQVTAAGCPSSPQGPFILSSPNPPATPTLTSNAPICSGNTLQLHATTTTTGTTIWNWSGPNGFNNSSSDPVIANIPATASGTYRATVTINNCTSAAGETEIVINPSPATPTITSNSPICSGSTLTFSNTPSGSGVIYSWTGPNGFTSTDQNPSISNVTTTATGSYQVTATLGSCKTEGSTTITVNELPVISNAIFTNPTQCATPTGTITLQGLKASVSYLVSYTQNGSPVSKTISAGNDGSILITGLISGIYDAIKVSLNNCLSDTKGPFVLSDPTPPATPILTSNAPICSGMTLQLNAGTTSTGITTWNWTGPNGYTSTEQNPKIENVSANASGTYRATVTISNCTSAPGEVPVIINPTPTVPAIGSNSPVCSGNNITFTNPSNENGVTYNWAGPNNFTSTDKAPTITGVTTTASGTYNITATLGTCFSKGSTEVLVNETPAIADITFKDPTQCASSTGTITVTGVSPSKTYTVNYTKNGTPQSATLSSDGSGNITITGLTAGTYDAVTVSINNCISNKKGPVTLTDPNPPAAPTVSSNAPLCNGTTLTLTASSGASGIYAWSGPNGFSSSEATPVIPGMTAANAGIYNVTITINNCTSSAGSVTVVVNALAAAPAAASPVGYCINTPASALTATGTNGGTLSWYNTASGSTPSSTAPTPVTSAAGSVFYYVSQISTAGCGGARTPIEVITHPDAIASFLPPQTLGCAPYVLDGRVINLQPYPDNNSNYLWYADGTTLGVGTAFPGYTIQNDHDSVNIKLVATSKYGCKSDSAEQKFFTYQLPKTAFATNSTGGCGPITISFTNKTPQASLFKFKWLFGNGQTSEEENPGPITFATNPTYGDTTYHVTLLGYTVCDTITATTDILVKSKPKSLFAPDKTNGCSPLPVRFDNISKGFGTGYQWFFGDGSTANTPDASSVTHTYNTGIQDTFYAKMVTTNDCGTDTSVFAIVVSPNKVKLNVALNGNQATGCAPHTVQFINRSSGATNFAWNFGDGNTLNTSKNIDTVPHIYAKSGTYTITLFASNGCSDTTTTETVTVFDKPVAGFTAAPLSVCIGDSVSFQNKATGFSSLSWQFGDNNSSSLTDPQHAYTAPGNYVAIQIAQTQYNNGTVCTDTAKASIAVVSKLPGAFTASAAGGSCVPFTVTFTNNTLPSISTTWTFSDGTTATGDVVTHTFIAAGSYTVSMQAKHPAGCLYEASQTIPVNAPSGTIAYTPGFVCNNTPVRFESNTTNTDSVRWDFGDGTLLTTKERVVYHVFDKPGVFVPNAELVATNGCRVPVATNDTVKVDYLQAGFAQQQDVICGKTTVHFNDTSRAFFGISQWQWNLGDGTETTQQNPVHDYTTSGTLPIQLITIGNSGCADTTKLSLPIKVNDKPVASILGPSAACDALPVLYNASVSAIDAVSVYQWTITGNASYNTAAIAHTFPSAGSYRIQLIAGTVYGCYDTAVQTVTVSTTPTVTASNDVTICRGVATSLIANGNAASYRWDADLSLSCTACNSPLAAPDSTTQYRVTGTALNGCTRTDSVLVTVIQPFVLTVTQDDSICIGQSKQLSVSGAYSYVWSPSNTLDDSTSQHPVATPAASTMYSVTGTDAYHCFTDTKMVVIGVGEYPTVSLGKDTTLSTGTVFPLHSVITEGPIKSYAWTPADNLSCVNCAVPDANIKRNTCYTLTATNYYGCAGKDTVCIKVFCESSQVFIANLFTPDGDGVNDKLVVQGKGIALIRSFRIFNRWGQVVFEKTSFPPNDASSGWDGRINGGALASEDVYVYTCDVVCDDGTVYPLKGNVAIVK